MAYIIDTENSNGLEVAIIGMAGRFPGANNVQALWDLLTSNKSAISLFKDHEIEDPLHEENVTRNPDYIKARGVIEGVEYFDAELFGYTPREASLLDPQVRIFHECAWEALEDAAYDPYKYAGLIGVFAGAHTNVFWEMKGLLSEKDVDYGNKDFIATRLSYKLNLKGPSQTIYTACSTTLVAVHMACRSLLNGECNMAIAGGASIELPQQRGYVYSQGGILSSSGQNKSFAVDADGTVFSNGAGVVILKLLEDAIRDNDNIYAVIKGTAINNDGDRKVSFTAPSVRGQVSVIRDALTFSGVNPEEISYVEAHGSATAVGDPIEIEALKQAFGSSKLHSCGIGSVKSNIGHTNAAAGISGLIKTVLSLKNKLIPASLNYETANPNLNLENSAFYIVKENTRLARTVTPIKMGVTSLGVGGTNAHAILEEAPQWNGRPNERKYELLTFSGKTDTALQNVISNFDKYIRDHQLVLSDAAYSLNTGRVNFSKRAMCVCTTSQALQDGQLTSDIAVNDVDATSSKTTIFAFPSALYYFDGLANQIYQRERIFKDALDSCFNTLNKIVGVDFYPVLDGGPQALVTGGKITADTALHGITFSIQYAIATCLIEFGISPDYMVGFSTGEYVSACLAGAIKLDDALTSIIFSERQPSVNVSNIKIPYISGFNARFVDKNTIDGNLPLLSDTDLDYGAGIDVLLQVRNSLILTLGAAHSFYDQLTGHPNYDVQNQHIINMLPCRDEQIDEERYFTRQLGAVWLAGKTINWAAYYGSENRRRISLPTYPFDRQKYGYEASDLSTIRALINRTVSWPVKDQQCLYNPIWKQAILPKPGTNLHDQKLSWLVFGAGNSLSYEMVEHLGKAGHKVVLVSAADSYAEAADDYLIDPTSREDYLELIDSLRKRAFYPDHIVHFWNTVSFNEGIDGFEHGQWYGYYSLIYLAQALSKLTDQKQILISVVTCNLHEVVGSEKVEKEKAALLGALAVIPHENLMLKFKNIDFNDNSSHRPGSEVNEILKEIGNNNSDSVIAYRNGKRWVEEYQQYHTGNGLPDRLSFFKERGTYVVVGGLGNIAIHLAHFIAISVKVNLVLIGRHDFPQRNLWDNLDKNDDSLSKKISLLKEIEVNGSYLDIRKSDVTDREAMKELWQELHGKYGRIDGVIHSAGVINDVSNLCPLELITKDISDEQFAAKVHGLYILDELFAKYSQPDFCIVMSSLASVLGGLGFTAYSAASAFMDSFVRSKDSSSQTRWISLNWDAWNFDYAKHIKDAHSYQLSHSMKPEEALQAFQLALTSGSKQVLISRGELHPRIKRYQRLRDNLSAGSHVDSKDVNESDYEKILIGLWRKYLGHKDIKLNDDFFKLGGNSFLLVALVNELGKATGKKITIKEFYQNSKVSGLLRLLKSRDSVSTLTLKPAEKKEYYALSAAQTRMYYHYALTPEGTNYNETKIFEIQSDADESRLQDAFCKLMHRHESLRTCFRIVGEEPVQVIQSCPDFKVDTFNNGSDDIGEFARQYVRPFDLACAPLFRVAIVNSARGRKYLVADFHHIVYDAISMDVMKNDLLKMYGGAEPNPVALQYKDASEFYNCKSYLVDLESQKRYWFDTMKGFDSAAEISPDYITAGSDITEEAVETITIEGEELNAIRTLVQQEEVSLFSFLIASLSVLTMKYSYAQDVTFGIPVSGRTEAAVNTIVGMFVNILPLRTSPDVQNQFERFLREVNRSNAGLVNYQNYPFNHLVSGLKQEHGIDGPLFYVVFNMISETAGSISSDISSADLFKCEIPYVQNRVSKYRFIVNVSESAHKISVSINYSPQQYRDSSIQRILVHYRQIIDTVVGKYDILLGDIRLEGLYEEAEVGEQLLDNEFDFS